MRISTRVPTNKWAFFMEMWKVDRAQGRVLP
jgi:hypothetical protein